MRSDLILNEQENDFSDEEQDELYAPKTMNRRTTMVPIHLYRILQAESNPEHRFSQVELQKILWKKYEIRIERKALSRYIHTLEDEGLGIKCDPKSGVWYDSDAEWQEYAV